MSGRLGPQPSAHCRRPCSGRIQCHIHTVTGSADTFEAQFVLELRDSANLVMSSQQVQATSGTGTRGTFDATVVFSARGPATIVAYERSPKDGSPQHSVSVAVALG